MLPMQGVLAAIGTMAVILAVLLLAVSLIDPAAFWALFDLIDPRPAPAVAAPSEPREPSRDPVIWTNFDLPDLVYRAPSAGAGGETVSTADGQVVEEWVTLYRWTGTGPRDLGTIDVPSDVWRVHYVASSSYEDPLLVGLVGPTDQTFADWIGTDLPRIIYRRGAGTYRVDVRQFTGTWDIAVQVPASAVR